jgi:hypothetical protein
LRHVIPSGLLDRRQNKFGYDIGFSQLSFVHASHSISGQIKVKEDGPIFAQIKYFVNAFSQQNQPCEIFNLTKSNMQPGAFC